MSIADLRAALSDGLAPLAKHKQFILYKLVERTDRSGKMDKIPVHARTLITSDAHNPDVWVSAEEACYTAESLGIPFGVGFTFTDIDPFFFIDIDSCLLPDKTGWNAIAMQLLDAYRGYYVEVSQSGNGLHIIGAYTAMPPHGSTNKAFGLEFYHTKRFAALTGTRAVGHAFG